MNRPPRVLRQDGGFTLTELALVIAVLGIIVAAAVPSFNSIIEAKRASSASLEMYNTLNAARSEAIKRNTTVTVTRSGTAWEDGWTMTAGGSTIASHNPLSKITVTTTATSIAYASTGRLSGGGAAPTFSIHVTGSSVGNDRCLTVDLSGAPRTAKGACP